MDPLTHTLAGAALAETRWARRTALALPTLLIAANLPDIDGILYTMDSDLALCHRRGWTHGVAAMAVLPLVLTGLVLLWDRWVRSRAGGDPPVRGGWILGLAYVGVLSHPLLDWLNTYGVRLLMPFDGRWFYGDVLHIVDPFVWLFLGGALFLIHSRTRLGLALWGLLAVAATLVVFHRFPFPVEVRVFWVAALVGLALLRTGWLIPIDERGGRRIARAGFALFSAYMAIQLISGSAARRLVASELERMSLRSVEALMVGPVAGNPFTRDVVAATPEQYRFGRFTWLPAPRLHLDPRPIPRREPTDAVRAARRAEEVRGLVGWSRFPYFEVIDTPEGFAVYLLDARYARTPRTGFGGAVVYLDRDLNPLASPAKRSR
jgi:inner membrane protein